MHKVLLIHNDNTPLKKSPLISSAILFSPSIDELNDSDMDTYISNKIIPKLKEVDFDLLIIKDSLSENYIDFYGLVLAYHIRLSKKDLENEYLVPIVILSEIDSYTINKITSLGKILFTKNIFICKNSIEAFEEFNNVELNSLDKEEYVNGFLKKIDIDPPKDYLSHHSIANEWAIYQWSHLLGVSTEATRINEDKINTMLYFKYLVNKYDLEEKTEKPNQESNKSGKVLFIDDKGVDGWNDVIRKFIESNYKSVEFFTLEEEATEQVFKDKDVTDLKPLIENKIKDTDPDVILLDLRLLEHIDNNQEKVLEISGIKILKYIKRLNPSIQVIIFSASTDSLILDELYANRILGYIKKDSPTNKYLASKNSLTKLDKLIKKGLDRKYLKRIWQIQQDTLKLPSLTNSTDSIVFELRKSIESVFDILNSNMPNSFVYAMLAIFKCLELINDYYLIGKYKEALWRVKPEGIANLNDNSTKNKILNIIKYKTILEVNEFEDLITVIVCSRNYAIHPKEKSSCKGHTIYNPNDTNIVRWFTMLFNILDGIKEKNDFK